MNIAIGIEIGGTKLQAGIGSPDEPLKTRVRLQVEAGRGAAGIREALPGLLEQLLKESGIQREAVGGIGVGFGGPIDSKKGVTLVSHQIDGWDHFPLRSWLSDQWGVPVAIQNDATLAGYAEARLGAGKGFGRVFYITIGSGIGGGWIVNGTMDEGQGLGAAEIGHTWVSDPETGEPEKLELLCSGWSIGRRAREAVESGEDSLLRQLAKGDLSRIDARMVYVAAEQDDLLANAILEETCATLAVGIGNVIALLNPERIVVGGGVSLMGPIFWDNLREKVEEFAFNPFAGTFSVVPALFGEDVVLVGGVLLGLELAEK